MCGVTRSRIAMQSIYIMSSITKLQAYVGILLYLLLPIVCVKESSDLISVRVTLDPFLIVLS